MRKTIGMFAVMAASLMLTGCYTTACGSDAGGCWKGAQASGNTCQMPDHQCCKSKKSCRKHHQNCCASDAMCKHHH